MLRQHRTTIIIAPIIFLVLAVAFLSIRKIPAPTHSIEKTLPHDRFFK